MELIIGVCTKNRNVLLHKCLLSLVRVYYPLNIKVKIVIIDNTTNNNAKNVYYFFSKRFINFKFFYFSNFKKGIPNSRNIVLSFARKLNPDLLGFVDDDCVIDRNWFISAYRTLNKNVFQIITGPQKIKQTTKDTLIYQKFLERNYEAKKKEVNWASTNNIIMKYKFLPKNIYFDTRLTNIGGSDQLFFRILKKYGVKIVWLPTSLVYEHNHVYRYKILWFLMRSFRYGQSGVYIDQVVYGKLFGSIINILKIIYLIFQSIVCFIIGLIEKNFILFSIISFFKASGRFLAIFGYKNKKYV